MYQVDPFGKRKAEQLTMGSDGGGKFEAFAYDVRNAVSVLFPFPHFSISLLCMGKLTIPCFSLSGETKILRNRG